MEGGREKKHIISRAHCLVLQQGSLIESPSCLCQLPLLFTCALSLHVALAFPLFLPRCLTLALHFHSDWQGVVDVVRVCMVVGGARASGCIWASVSRVLIGFGTGIYRYVSASV